MMNFAKGIFFSASETQTTKSLASHSHYVKSVQIRSFFWSVFSCIRTEYRKILTRKNSVFGHLSRSVCMSRLLYRYNIIIVIIIFFILVRWKIQLLEIPTTAGKVELSFFNTKFAISILITNCNTFSIANDSM